MVLTRAGVRRDHAQLEKMRQLGMSVEDEYKLSALREYIAKVAAARQACVSSQASTLCPRADSDPLAARHQRITSSPKSSRPLRRTRTCKTSASSRKRSSSPSARKMTHSLQRASDSRILSRVESRMRRPPDHLDHRPRSIRLHARTRWRGWRAVSRSTTCAVASP